jgi:hypothetical protein
MALMEEAAKAKPKAEWVVTRHVSEEPSEIEPLHKVRKFEVMK